MILDITVGVYDPRSEYIVPVRVSVSPEEELAEDLARPKL